MTKAFAPVLAHCRTVEEPLPKAKKFKHRRRFKKNKSGDHDSRKKGKKLWNSFR